jgi:hypothetical protein
MEALSALQELAKVKPREQVKYTMYPKPKRYEKLLYRLSATASLPRGTAFIPRAVFDLGEDACFRLANNGRALPIMPL